jgi:hypothetical protein
MAQQRGVGFKTTANNLNPKGTKHFLGIGIDKYNHWPHLRNAVNDVAQVQELLLEQYDFEAQNMIILRDHEATRANIVNRLHAYTKAETLGEHDSLLIYFSGHGDLDENDDGYWAPVDAQRKEDNIDSLIPNSTVRDKIKSMKCRHVLLVSDSCFSGSLISRGDDHREGANLVADALEQKKSRRIMTSGGHDQTVSDGKRNSPFAEAILSELRHNHHPQLIIDDLFHTVRKITRSNAEQMPQLEPLFGAGDMGGRFVFNLKHARKEKPDKKSDRILETPAPTRSDVSAPPAPKATADNALAKQHRDEIMKLVAMGQTETAIKRFVEIAREFYPRLSTDVIQLSSRWQTLKKQELMGILSFSEAGIERNRINSALLEMLRELA